MRREKGIHTRLQCLQPVVPDSGGGERRLSAPEGGEHGWKVEYPQLPERDSEGDFLKNSGLAKSFFHLWDPADGGEQTDSPQQSVPYVARPSMVVVGHLGAAVGKGIAEFLRTKGLRHLGVLPSMR